MLRLISRRFELYRCLIPAHFEKCEVPYGLKELQYAELFEKDGYSKAKFKIRMQRNG